MSAFASALTKLAIWINGAAAGFDILIDLVRPRREIRFVERDDGSFSLQRKVYREKWASLGEPIRIEEGIILSALPVKAVSAMRGAKLEIVLQIKHFVVRSLELPAGATAFLDGVLRAQIDRLTPWKPAEAAFGSTNPQSLGSDRIVIRVVATARARLTALLPTLKTYDIQTLKVFTDVDDGNHRSEVCVLSETIGAGRRIQRLSSALTAILTIASLAAFGAVAFWLTVGTSLDAQRDELERVLHQRRAEVLARRSGRDVEAIAAINARKQAQLPSVLAIEALSKTLPDNTYLTDLHIEDGKLQIAGFTHNAPALISLIEQSHQFSHAAFFEPTTHTPNESGERFHVEALIEPRWMTPP